LSIRDAQFSPASQHDILAEYAVEHKYPPPEINPGGFNPTE
jgi:hypothetical protein